MIYVALDTVLNETFADTASRDYLIMRCAERGITPLPATCAVGIGEFSMDIPIGTRFSCDKYNWAVTEKIESLKYYLTCETAGEDPNGYTGQLIPIEYIEGLATAELTSIVINGEDEEATETLRLRYLNSFENSPTASIVGSISRLPRLCPASAGASPTVRGKVPEQSSSLSREATTSRLPIPLSIPCRRPSTRRRTAATVSALPLSTMRLRSSVRQVLRSISLRP